jgi:hypothetical protein
MESISRERLKALHDTAREICKLELRDHYGIDGELFSSWQAGDLGAVDASYRRWRDRFMTEFVEPGRSYRRVRVVTEPLSEYQQMAVAYSGITVEVGEGLRWLPRRLVSAVALPGNDCMILEGQAVVFIVMDADAGNLVEAQYSAEPDVVKFCVDAFEGAWTLATPHAEYRAQMIPG